MRIDIKVALKVASIKWKLIHFALGLFDNCIGVDPYYLPYKTKQMGYHFQIILSGKKIKGGMGKYIAESTVKLKVNIRKFFVVTFKENKPDTR